MDRDFLHRVSLDFLMTKLLLTGWDWEPSVVVGCAALAIGYLAAMRRRLPLRALWFLGGVLLLLLDLVSPIDALADGYLFSAHIAQHFLLALVIPPLLILGLPTLDLDMRLPAALPTFAAWLLGVGTMLIWHVPAFFNAALASDALHIFQHLTFLASGVIFWWPVLCPIEENRLPPIVAVPYLFSACTACSLLGAAITFGSPGLYPAYLHPDDRLGILPLIRDGWGLDAKSDQQLGGLLMWVPGCFVYLSAILATVSRWYRTPEDTLEAEA
jgi:putative membrane protein